MTNVEEIPKITLTKTLSRFSKLREDYGLFYTVDKLAEDCGCFCEFNVTIQQNYSKVNLTLTAGTQNLLYDMIIRHQ